MITAKTIQQVTEEILAQAEKDAHAFMEALMDEQPFLITYLLACSDTLHNKHRRDELYFEGLIIYCVFKKEYGSISEITEAQIDSVEKMLDGAANAAESSDTTNPENFMGNEIGKIVMKYQSLFSVILGNQDLFDSFIKNPFKKSKKNGDTKLVFHNKINDSRLT